MRPYIPLTAILLLALALRAPGWFTADEKRKYEIFPSNEFQHVEIAVSAMKNWDKDLYTDWDVDSKIYNVQGFGIQMGAVAFVAHLLTGWTPDAAGLITIGRILSTLYALLLIWLTFRIGLHLFHSRLAALLGAFLLAIFDLNVTNSHYAIPAVAYSFWTYAAVFLMIVFYSNYLGRKPADDPGWALSLAIPFTAAAAFATKFDFIPTVFAGAILLFLLWRGKYKLKTAVGYAGTYVAFFLLFFYIFTLFNFGWVEVRHGFDLLYRENHDVIQSDNHLLYNPLLYFAGVTGGTSALVMIVFLITLASLLARGKAFGARIALRWWIFFILLEFLVRWSMDTAFIRRAGIFLPFVAVLAGRGLAGILRGNLERPAWQRLGATWLVVLYTLVLTLLSQSNFWFDPRYRAKNFLTENYPQAEIYYSPYAYAEGMPPGLREQEEADLLVVHESFYSRYWKSFTTPFQYPPDCCEEVYHCRSVSECQFYQNLLSGKNEDYELVRTFPTKEYLPERVLFKDLFGSFETFLGDVRVYRKKGL